jgi:hypothetical protein
MRLIIYGDFNCPYSYQASQRADALLRLGHARSLQSRSGGMFWQVTVW